MATPRRSTRKSAANATASIRDLALPVSSTPRRRARPLVELVGKRINVSWPRDRNFYAARVIDFNDKKKLHKVIYDEDNSIEELNLLRRKYNELEPTDEEKLPDSIIGKKIILEVETKDPDAPTNDYTAIVLRIATSTPSDDDGEDEEEDKGKEGENVGDVVEHEVIYLSNEYITVVNLAEHKYTIVDMQTGNHVRVVNPELGAVQLDSLAADDEVMNDEEKKTEKQPEPKKQSVSKEGAVESKVETSKTNADDKVVSTDDAPKPTVEPKNTQTETKTTPTPVEPIPDSRPAPGDSNVTDENAKGTEQPVIESNKPDVQEPCPGTADGTVPAASSPVKKVVGDDNLVVDRAPLANEIAADDDPKPVTPVDEKSTAAVTEKSVDVEMTDVTTTAEVDVSTEANNTANGAAVEPISPSEGNTNEDPKPPQSTNIEPAATAEENLNEPTPNVAPVPAKDPSNDIKASVQKPLTAENLNMLDRPNAKTNEATNGNAVAAEAGDDDTNTVSETENENWENDSKKLANPKSVVKKFVGVKVDGKERVAFVEGLLGNGMHFIAFHDTEGGQIQMLLTTENCRMLNDDEVNALGGERNMPPKVPASSGTPSSTKRKAANGKEAPSSKRRRANQPAVPSRPPPGMDIIGKCISVTWPGNGGNYMCLVVGCRVGKSETTHKVYYVDDESTETVDLGTRTWNPEVEGSEPWNTTGLVGKRLFVYWEGEYTDKEKQDRAVEKFGNTTKIPYEAFVVKFLGPHKYRLLYTLDDQLEDRVLNDDDEDWNVLEDGVAEVEGLPVISWTGPDED